MKVIQEVPAESPLLCKAGQEDRGGEKKTMRTDGSEKEVGERRDVNGLRVNETQESKTELNKTRADLQNKTGSNRKQRQKH